MSRMLDGGSAAAGFRSLGISFRLVGWFSFWIKLVMGIVSGGIVLFATPFAFANRNAPAGIPGQPSTSSPSGGLGLLIIAIGIICLGVSVFWSYRYTRFSRRFLIPNAGTKPSKSETVRFVKLALLTDIVGMLVAVIGGQWIVGVIIGKAISQGIVFAGGASLIRVVEPIELFVIQACINTMTGLFAGIASSLWLLQRITQVRSPQ
ncbi:MAG: DUF3611 family protein [Thermosynechococcaceae cyanobacterium]